MGGSLPPITTIDSGQTTKQMKTVRVFIASSNELTPEREKFDTLFNHLNEIYTARGVNLKSVKWEFLDSSMGREHKQQEYNRELKTCDICVVMFWQKFGDYTKEELDVANAELQANRKPVRIYVFFKEPGDISAELQEFKHNFDKEYSYGHFYCTFDCTDKLQLDFVLQLERFLNSSLVKVENSQIKIDEVVVAHMDNVAFAAGNEKYRSLREQLQELNEDIEDLESSAPLSASKEERLNKKKQKRNELREQLKEHEQVLLGAAVRVAQFAGERISDRMKRAVALFEQGKVSEANAVLDEAERDADEILKGIREIKTVGKQSVDELLIRASYMLADERYSIDKRITNTENVYKKALELALECSYEDEKHHKLLCDYFDFLSKYGKYKEALDIAFQNLELSERVFGKEHQNTATSHDKIGLAYYGLKKYEKALEFYTKALTIYKNIYRGEHYSIANSYNNIGSTYHCLGKDNYKNALEFYTKALGICKNIYGEEHSDTACSYNNIGSIYHCLGNYEKALEFHTKALTISKKVLGEEHQITAMLYVNVGIDYGDFGGDYKEVLKFYTLALLILIKVLGDNHTLTASVYSKIGKALLHLKLYDKALIFFNKELDIRKKVLAKNQIFTARMCQDFGAVYYFLGRFEESIKFLKMALNYLPDSDPSILTIRQNIKLCQEELNNNK